MRGTTDKELLEFIAELTAAAQPFVCVTVIGTKGRTPRKAGAKMVVARDGRTLGTVGGGAVESKAIETAKALLQQPRILRVDWDLAAEEGLGMHCGGRMELLFEPFLVRPRAFIFGAGHVGYALAGVLRFLGFDLTVVDPRDELLTPDRFLDARLVKQEPHVAAASLDIGASDFCAVLNPKHEYDLETMDALCRREWAYLGLMASKKKRRDVFKELSARGIPNEVLDRVHCPIGAEIGAETPEEIAVAIAAEMVQVRRRGRDGIREGQ